MKFDDGVSKSAQLHYARKIGKTTRIYVLSSWGKERIQEFLKQFPSDFAANYEKVEKVRKDLEAAIDRPDWMTAVFIFVNELYTINIGRGSIRFYREGHEFLVRPGEEVHTGDAILLQSPEPVEEAVLDPLEIEVDFCKAESSKEWLDLLNLRCFWKAPKSSKCGVELAAIRMYY